jgi:hypothetical protein
MTAQQAFNRKVDEVTKWGPEWWFTFLSGVALFAFGWWGIGTRVFTGEAYIDVTTSLLLIGLGNVQMLAPFTAVKFLSKKFGVDE